MAKINIEDIYFGDRDALHEYMKQDREDINVLDNSFVNPPRVRMEELISGARFYILGPKGSGKTTLLWHLKRAGVSNKSKVILFKTDLKKEDRDRLDKMVDMIVVEDQREFRLEMDYKTIWEWYILKNIIRTIDPNDLIEGGEYFKDVVLLLEADNKRFNTLYDKFNIDSVKGNIKLNIDLGALKSEISAEVSARRTEENRIPLLDLVRLVQECVTRFRLKSGVSVRLYFDELEFYMSEDGDGERDRRMVRDLLFAIYNINKIFSEKNINIVTYASVRYEILNSIKSTNQELDKIVTSFGVSLDWYQESIDSHPILNIVERKINYSEIIKNGNYTEDVWSSYFPQFIYKTGFKKYLLDNGIHRPRGVILRLISAAEQAYGRDHFIASDFIDSEDRFGQIMLDEFFDEISAIYDGSGREAIISIFRGNKYEFTINDIERRLNEAARRNKDAARIRDKLGAENLLRLLFRIGMIGNQFNLDDGRERNVWAVRGFTDPIIERRFVLHRSIRKILVTV